MTKKFLDFSKKAWYSKTILYLLLIFYGASVLKKSTTSEHIPTPGNVF